jgi:hypothetical protein
MRLNRSPERRPGEAGGGERFQPQVKPDPELEQQFEGQIVRDQALEVAQGGPRDPKESDGHEDHGEIENGWAQRRGRDQVT